MAGIVEKENYIGEPLWKLLDEKILKRASFKLRN